MATLEIFVVVPPRTGFIPVVIVCAWAIVSDVTGSDADFPLD